MRALASAAFVVALATSHGTALAQTAGVTQECLPESFAAIDVACSDQLVDELREPVSEIAAKDIQPAQKIEEYKRIFAAASVPPACQEAQRLLFQAVAACNSSDLARSLDAPATNPASLALVERGGTIEDVALALRTSTFVSADDTAVTLHLNAAVALCGSRDRPTEGSEPTACVWDRLTGAVTFGAKIPEQEIVGYSGIPDPERLLDVLVWDANLRLVGDRRPDSAKWRSQWNAMAVDGWVRLKGLNTGLFPEDFSDESTGQRGRAAERGAPAGPDGRLSGAAGPHRLVAARDRRLLRSAPHHGGRQEQVHGQGHGRQGHWRRGIHVQRELLLGAGRARGGWPVRHPEVVAVRGGALRRLHEGRAGQGPEHRVEPRRSPEPAGRRRRCSGRS